MRRSSRTCGLRSRLHGVLRERSGAKITKGHPDLCGPTSLLVMRKIDDFDEPAVEVERQPFLRSPVSIID